MRHAALVLALAAVGGVAPAGLAQSSVNRTTTVTATVIKALSVVNVTAGSTLDLGRVAVGQAAPRPINPKASAAFELKASGQPNTAVTVTFANATLSRAGGGTLTFAPTVSANATESKTQAAQISSPASLTLSASPGEYYFWVGGGVTTVPANTPVGTYSGTWTLTVAYTGI